jgi:hypothetical protein
MIDSHARILRTFFDRYAEATVKGDIDAIIAAYAGTYIEAGPGGVAVYEIDDAYKAALEAKSTAMRDQLGLEHASATLQRIDSFAPDHFLIDVDWTMRFESADRGTTTSRFRISYTVRLDGDVPTILLYVSHEDEETVMKRDGVI